MYRILILNNDNFIIVNDEEIKDIIKFIKENKNNFNLCELVEEIEGNFDASLANCDYLNI